jgi:hypothetical protein
MQLRQVWLALAVTATGLAVVFVWPPAGIVVTASGLALVRRATPGPRSKATRPDSAPAFDFRRPRDLAAFALILTAVVALTAVYLTGPVSHPAHLTVPIALAVVIVMVARTIAGRDRSGS